jgi:thioredoxin-related protein
MKLLTFVIVTFFTINITWLGNFSEAQKQAAQEHKLILVNFSGSDWCGPCIRLRKEILESGTFKDYAAQNLVLVRADFPREKKNQPSKEQIKLNNALADKYNPDGKFHYTLLMDDTGKILQTWEGFPNLTPEQFVEKIKQFKNLNPQ